MHLRLKLFIFVCNANLYGISVDLTHFSLLKHMRIIIITMRKIGKASMIIQIFKNPLYAALKTVVSYVYFMKMVHGIQMKLAKKAQTVAMKKMIVVQK